eukprot:CAMPEP_0114990140 /NCGR_PEP_ID=MMETSP0216-20121206/10613_1 /TAXON_ID=223996 /ORGANISM="Protocruzia adherens, Strain Boccale" /LENGTH=459 /DNA_ID=CAMNT_0002353247 /DNA_START=259 /DNA_END=1638 /DNA_ORIENTATION=+
MHLIWITQRQIKRQQRDIQMKMKKNDIIAAALGIVGSSLAFFQTELYYDFQDEYVPQEMNTVTTFHGYKTTPINTMLRVIITITTALLLVFIYRHYRFYIKFLKARQKLDIGDDMRSSGLLYPLLFELVFCSIHMPPGVNYEFYWPQYQGEVYFSLDSLVTSIMLCRLYLVWRLFSLYSSWADHRAEQICNDHYCEGGANFAVKAELKERPYTIVSCVLMATTIIFGVALRNAELPYLGVSNQDWSYYWNGMWCVIITMTSVGFGDYYPTTHVGRIMGILASIFGTFIVSLMVVSLTISSEFTPQEKKAYERIKEQEDVIKLRTYAADAIGSAVRLHFFFKENKTPNNRQVAIHVNKFKRNILRFRSHVRTKNANEQLVPIENILLKLINKINTEMETIKKDCDIYQRLFVKMGELESSQSQLQEEIDKLKKINTSIYDKLSYLKHIEKNDTLFQTPGA